MYIDDLAAQSGASMFLQAYSPPFGTFISTPFQSWTYDKTDNRTDFSQVDYVITERTDLVDNTDEWRIAEGIRAFNGRLGVVERLQGKRDVPLIGERVALWILERREVRSGR